MLHLLLDYLIKASVEGAEVEGLAVEEGVVGGGGFCCCCFGE